MNEHSQDMVIPENLLQIISCRYCFLRYPHHSNICLITGIIGPMVVNLAKVIQSSRLMIQKGAAFEEFVQYILKIAHQSFITSRTGPDLRIPEISGTTECKFTNFQEYVPSIIQKHLDAEGYLRYQGQVEYLSILGELAVGFFQRQNINGRESLVLLVVTVTDQYSETNEVNISTPVSGNMLHFVRTLNDVEVEEVSDGSDHAVPNRELIRHALLTGELCSPQKERQEAFLSLGRQAEQAESRAEQERIAKEQAESRAEQECAAKDLLVKVMTKQPLTADERAVYKRMRQDNPNLPEL